MIEYIPLSKLRLSDLNVRKTERDVEIASLADDIAARGLKQNLIVIPLEKGGYEVIAGGRRFQALEQLVKRKVIKKDEPVACMIDVAEQAVETSLSENLHRVAMNPADEFLAFSTVIEAATGTEDERIAYCAKRFGKGEKHVRGRLRLANLSPTILTALREQVIWLDAAQAYASVDDHALQDKVFAAQQKSTWKPHDPSSIRDGLKAKTYSPNDPKVKFIGVKAYTEAGGRIDRDMFSLDATERLLDTAVVDKLVAAKLEKALPKFGKEHGAVGAVLTQGMHYAAAAPSGWDAVYDSDGKKQKAATRPVKVSCYIDGDGKLAKGVYTLIEADPEAAPKEEQRGYVPETDEQRAARWREIGIRNRAIRMAFPACAGTPLEGRIYFPASLDHARVQEQGDDYFIEVTARISKAEAEAMLAAAETAYDDAKAAEAKAKADAEAAKEQLKLDTIASKPAVVRTGRWGDSVYFRWADDTYMDAREGDPEVEADSGYTTIEELIEEVHTIFATYETVEAYDAAMTAEQQSADEDEDEDDLESA